ncbi:hypothetical protein GRT64_000119 [Salmonella enterica]|nr:hypothetical protein [Salmonella enterica]ECS8659504.1 hypothetical protein [Salmonella enterica subsp. enterica serovar Cotham]EDW5541828.1 hypothetical protein [Salmonella enterica subsp. enterica serovar Gaminara]HCM1888646.1 hypothetical protein [Salmonella enterica subsp. diarizonae serovar 57:c:z]EAP6464123.1 hypothetical protein [Salmonella enterica]
MKLKEEDDRITHKIRKYESGETITVYPQVLIYYGQDDLRIVYHMYSKVFSQEYIEEGRSRHLPTFVGMSEAELFQQSVLYDLEKIITIQQEMIFIENSSCNPI